MKIYKSHKIGKLLIVRAYIKGNGAEHHPRMLIDTGSTYTIIAQEILEAIGCSPTTPIHKERITTANGYIIIPAVRVQQFYCLGEYHENMAILAHTFPAGAYIDGLLGMDFLSEHSFEIRTQTGEIIRL